MYSILNTKVSTFRVRHSGIQIYETRNRDKLVLPLARKARTQSGFFFQGVKEWNGLPDKLKNSENKSYWEENWRHIIYLVIKTGLDSASIY